MGERHGGGPVEPPDFNKITWQEVLDDRVERKLQGIHVKLDELKVLILSGFPEGDPLSHRKAHELMMALAGDNKKLTQTVKTKIVESVVYGILIAAVTAGWYWIKGNIR
jgi:hypothetical protein